MVQTMSEMLFANLDVSTNVLSWLIIFIAEDGAIQEQLRQEINASDDASHSIYKDKASLMHFCLLESIRLRPFTGMGNPSRLVHF